MFQSHTICIVGVLTHNSNEIILKRTSHPSISQPIQRLVNRSVNKHNESAHIIVLSGVSRLSHAEHMVQPSRNKVQPTHVIVTFQAERIRCIWTGVEGRGVCVPILPCEPWGDEIWDIWSRSWGKRILIVWFRREIAL